MKDYRVKARPGMSLTEMNKHSPTINTETKKQRPNTGARANNTRHKYLGYPIWEPAKQSACEVRLKARHAPLAAYAAPVVEDVQEHAFCLREIIHLRTASESFTTAAFDARRILSG